MQDRVPERAEREYEAPPSERGGILKSLMPSAVVSAVVVFVAGMFFSGLFFPNFVTKSDFETNIKSVAEVANSAKASITAIDARSTQSTTDLAGAKKDIALLQTGVAGLASQTSVNSLQADLNTLKTKTTDTSGVTSQITALQTKIDTLTQKLSDDEVLIKSLQNTGTAGTVTATGLVKAAFSTSNYVPTGFTPTTTTPSFQLPFKLTVTNGLNKTINNLQLYISMYASSNVAGATGVSLQPISGGAWSLYTTSGNNYFFTNTSMSAWGGTSLSIPPNSSQVITLIFSYTAPAAAYGTMVNFSPDVAPIGTNDYTVG